MVSSALPAVPVDAGAGMAAIQIWIVIIGGINGNPKNLPNQVLESSARSERNMENISQFRKDRL
jgi:hypothetical protein